MVQRFDLASTPSVPWKNGGGSTRELACWPQGAGMDGFEWRVSVATIAAPGPFSAFPGVDRQIMLLDGDGVHLRSDDGQLDHALNQHWQPLAFQGDLAVDCRMLGGTSTDLNLMVRRGRWRGRLQVTDRAHDAGQARAGLCLVLRGRWRCGTQVLEPGQGLWWSERSAENALEPLAVATQGQADPALAWIDLDMEPSDCAVDP
jgi:hypothetical protein